MKVKLVNLGIVMLIVFFSFSIASGASQSKDNIISDSLEEIQSFFESQNSFLATYKTIVVCPSGCTYSSIQSAIDSANIGDTIEVQSGIYYENVNITKQVILRGVGNPIVDAGGSGSAITISADGVTLEGFNAINSSNEIPIAGIVVVSNNNTIINNKLIDVHRGILLISNNSTVDNNTIRTQEWYGPENESIGIWLFEGSFNYLANNSISRSITTYQTINLV